MERMHNGEEQVHSCMGNVPRLPKFYLKILRKYWELFFILLHVTSPMFIKEGLKTVVEGAGLEGSALFVAFHECIGGSNHEKDVSLSGNVRARVSR